MRRGVILLLVASGLLGAPSAGGAQADDYGDEPSALSASLLPDENVQLQGQIETVGDVDCFMFNATVQGTYLFTTSQLSGSLDTLLILFDRNGRTVLAVDDNGAGDRASSLTFSAAFDGFYFICVRNARATQGTGGYVLAFQTAASDQPATTVTLPPPSEQSEPVEPDDTTTPSTEESDTDPEPTQTTPPPQETTPPAQTRPTTLPSTVLKEGRIALLGGDDDASIANVQDYLRSMGAFAAVEAINVSQRTPSQAELNPYEAVLVWADSGFFDADALGDVLADYVDRGGGVVVAAVSFDVPDPFDPDTLGGRFLSGGYYVIKPEADNLGDDRRVLGAVQGAGHPVMQGIRKIDGGPSSLHSPTAALTSGATTLASWDNGDVLAAAKAFGQVNRVDINLFPPSSLLNPDLWPFTQDNDVPRLFANALWWVAGRQAPFSQGDQAQSAILEASPLALDFSSRAGGSPQNQSLTLKNLGGQALTWMAASDASWLQVSPAQGELQPGASQALIVSVQAASLAVGTYGASVTLAAPGAQNGAVRIPVTLTLDGVGATMPTTPVTPVNPGSGRVLKVPEQFNTLSAAFAEAQSGDAIELAAGTYNSVALTLDKAITLKGAAGNNRSILNGNGRDPVIAIAVRDGGLLLQNLTISGGNTGILVGDGARATIDGVLVSDNYGWGVRLLGAAHVTLTGSVITLSQSGGLSVDIGNAANENLQLTASGNTIQGNRGCGVFVASDEKGINISGSGNRVEDNHVDLCDNGRKLPAGFITSTAEDSAKNSAKQFDGDGDGVPDATDFCPITPGKPEKNGCP